MKFLKKLAMITLFLNICFINVNAQDTENPNVKIGLFYGSNAVPTTNLDNYTDKGNTGGGHKFGFFDSENEFISVFDTDYEKITVMKDKNIYLGSDGLYYDTKLSNPKGTIGAYHLELSKTFDNESDAEYKALSIGQDAFVAYIDGKYKVRVGSYVSESHAEENISIIENETGDDDLKVVGFSDDTYTVTNTKTTKILFEFSSNSKFGVMPKGKITWNKGYRYYGGFEYSRQNGNDVTVVNVVSMQDYVKGVIPYEMNAAWHIEALKAQALTARSYAFNNEDKHSKYGFDLCTSTDCQVYRGTSQANENSDRAVDETLGEYIDYKGDIVTAFFYSSNGGASEDSENVWNAAIPYLRGVVDPYEQSHLVNNGVWSQKVTNSQIATVLQAKGYSINGVSDMYISKYTNMGNVHTLTVEDLNGKKYNFTKEKARIILNSSSQGITIKSQRYRINEKMPGEVTIVTGDTKVYINDDVFDADYGFQILGQDGLDFEKSIEGFSVITANGINQIEASKVSEDQDSDKISVPKGTYVIDGRGWGHNVGMSQYGAKAMAEQGFTYEEIVTFYYTDTTVKRIR